jgi:hypothetical protein
VAADNWSGRSVLFATEGGDETEAHAACRRYEAALWRRMNAWPLADLACGYALANAGHPSVVGTQESVTSRTKARHPIYATVEGLGDESLKKRSA